MNSINESFAEYDSMQCIWMQSNVVKYKLCDFAFDCDNCLFDKVMRNRKNEINEFLRNPTKNESEKDVVSSAIEKIKATGYSKKLIYLKNSLILKKLFHDTYYLGVNPIAYVLIDQISAYNYCRDNTDKKAGEPLVQFTGDWGSISVPSPLNFNCLGRLKPELNDLQLNSWFSLIETDEEDITSASITEDEFNRSREDAIEIISNSQRIFPSVGMTLNDGGDKVRFLYQAIGQLNYYTLIRRLFNL